MLPAQATFASGDAIPIGLILSCPGAPAIPKILTPNVGVFLIKRKKMWTSGGRQISIREQLVSKAEEFHLSDLQEGSRYLNIALQAGQAGCESSWKVHRAVAIEVSDILVSFKLLIVNSNDDHYSILFALSYGRLPTRSICPFSSTMNLWKCQQISMVH